MLGIFLFSSQDFKNYFNAHSYKYKYGISIEIKILCFFDCFFFCLKSQAVTGSKCYKCSRLWLKLESERNMLIKHKVPYDTSIERFLKTNVKQKMTSIYYLSRCSSMKNLHYLLEMSLFNSSFLCKTFHFKVIW